jgi:hypothetical protein
MEEWREAKRSQNVAERKGEGVRSTRWDHSEKVASKIPWRRQYIFTCPISFRDLIDTGRFHFDIEKTGKSGIQLI